VVDVLSCLHWRDQITNSLVLGDHVVLGRRQSARLSCTGGCPEDKNTLFEEALADRFSQVLPEASAVDGLVPLTVMVRTIFFRSGECGVVLDRFRTLYPWVVLNGIKDFVDGESRRSEVLFHLEALE